MFDIWASVIVRGRFNRALCEKLSSLECHVTRTVSLSWRNALPRLTGAQFETDTDSTEPKLDRVPGMRMPKCTTSNKE